MKAQKKGKWIAGLAGGFFVLIICTVAWGGNAGTKTSSSAGSEGSALFLAAKDTNEPKKEIPTYYKLLKKAMDQLFAVIESIANDKTLTVEQQKQKVKRFIEVVRWGPEKKDTFWAMDMQGKHLVNVYQPDLVGKDLSNFKDPTGIMPFAETLRIAREKGEGFLNYQWPRYDGKMPVPHIAFIRLMPQWAHVLGTHIPMDVVEGYEEGDVVLYVLEAAPPPPQVESTGGRSQ